MKPYSAVVLAFLTTTSALFAQVSQLSEEIVVTASALRETVEETPASVTVIGRKEIEQRAARDVADVLREVPGLTIARSGSPGKATSLFTRGSNSTHTLVLWNGIEINNPFFGGYDWGQLSTVGVERVEVVRGPFSSLYGSDAMAGVVNILTSSASPGLRAAIESGGNGLRNGQIATTQFVGPVTLSGALESRRDGGFAENDDFEQSGGNLALRWAATPSLSLGLVSRYSAYDLGIPTNLNAALDTLVPTPARRQNGSERQIALPIDQTLGKFSWSATFAEHRRQDELTDPEDPFGLTSQLTTATIRRGRLSTRTETGAGTIVAGAEYERSRVDDITNFGPNLTGKRREERSLFVEDRLSRTAGRARLELSAGLRHDRFETFGSETSPRMAAAFIFAGHKLRAAYGQAFRAPSIGELYSPFGGNAGLRAEHSRSVELGYERFTTASELSLTLFRDDYRDLITNVGFVFTNIGRARSRGVELSGRRTLHRGFEVGGSYTFVDAKQLDRGTRLLRRPPHSGSAFVAYRRSAAGGTVVFTHAGVRDDVLPVMPFSVVSGRAWSTVDLNLHYTAGSFEPYFNLENALDERYEEVRGYPSPGRRAVVGLRFTM